MNNDTCSTCGNAIADGDESTCDVCGATLCPDCDCEKCAEPGQEEQIRDAVCFRRVCYYFDEKFSGNCSKGTDEDPLRVEECKTYQWFGRLT